jgi:hypothetical protein
MWRTAAKAGIAQDHGGGPDCLPQAMWLPGLGGQRPWRMLSAQWHWSLSCKKKVVGGREEGITV